MSSSSRTRVLVYGSNLAQGLWVAESLRMEHGIEAEVVQFDTDLRQDKAQWWRDDLPEVIEHRFKRRPVWLGPLRRLSPMSRRLRDLARRYDALLVREDGPAVFSDLGVPMVFWAQGADIQTIPFPSNGLAQPSALRYYVASHSISLQNGTPCADGRGAMPCWLAVPVALGFYLMRLAQVLLRYRQQARGITEAAYCAIMPYQLPLARALGIREDRVRYVPSLTSRTASRRGSREGGGEGLEGTASWPDVLTVLHLTRQYHLAGSFDPFNKANDKLLQAISELSLHFSPRELRVLMVCKGSPYEIKASVDRLAMAGVSDYVEWVPEQAPEQLAKLIMRPRTLVADQFCSRLSSIGDIGRWALTHGVPLVTAYDAVEDQVYGGRPPNLYPAASAREIRDAIISIAALSEQEWAIRKARSEVWVSSHISDAHTVDRLAALLEAAARGAPNAFTGDEGGSSAAYLRQNFPDGLRIAERRE